jgi:hypothetical protein
VTLEKSREHELRLKISGAMYCKVDEHKLESRREGTHPWGSADLGQEGEFIFVHDTA